MTQNKCPLCASDSYKLILEGTNYHGRHLVDATETFKLVECLNCGTSYLYDITFDNAYYKKYYDEAYYELESTTSLVSSLIRILRQFSYWKKFRFFSKKLKKAKITVLDVGCGDGNFLDYLNTKEDIDPVGVELNEQGYNYCKSKGHVVYNKKLEEFFPDIKYDVICMWSVLEHIELPTVALVNASRLMNSGGVLIFQIPNVHSLGYKLGKKFWFHLDMPRHTNFMDQKTLVKFLLEQDLICVGKHNEFYDFPLDLLWSVRKRKVLFLITILFYPLLKLISKETITYVFYKK